MQLSRDRLKCEDCFGILEPSGTANDLTNAERQATAVARRPFKQGYSLGRIARSRAFLESGTALKGPCLDERAKHRVALWRVRVEGICREDALTQPTNALATIGEDRPCERCTITSRSRRHSSLQG